ncbi:phosphotransferase family protein [Albimonas sp. CAU 1670]|uniref:phosphotransferase family protein n=1 Tax=Albimonas sp. CAU 1670 TaxID=3032599 RepID=UPI0023DBBBC1|nr:phosphotransferase family protein [Albimonas sp. CAU 1670]MDF2235696.1 phosphotransferase family protein [Albimonas sp. CAU 1670]
MTFQAADRSLAHPLGPAATTEALTAWAAEAAGGRLAGCTQISGGNRCRSWAVDVETGAGLRPLYLRYAPPRPPSVEPYTVRREAQVYRALDGTDVPAPRLLAEHARHEAILTERAPGRSDYRRIGSDAEKTAVAKDFVAALARLHALPGERLAGPDVAPAGDMRTCVARELEIWRGMYAETGRRDPLAELALGWLEDRLPETPGAPVFVHGDAGPGNFLFQDGRMTALLDWELAHAGDPMEDLAWYSMRSVMEPTPDFAARVRDYAAAGGAPLDPARILYHRVFVSARVVIIRHRNVTGEPGASIISRALNRRLLVGALAEASGLALTPPPAVEAPETPQTGFHDGVIDDLRARIAERVEDAEAVSAAKNAARVLKYLREVDRLGPAVEARKRAALAALLGDAPDAVAEGEAELLALHATGRVRFAQALPYFAAAAAWDAQLAALASGGMARRGFPDLPHAL